MSGVKMIFAHDTTAALVLAADLVNSGGSGDPAGGSGDPVGGFGDPVGGFGTPAGELRDPAALDAFLDAHDVVPHPVATQADVRAVGELRARLRAIWDAADVPSLAAMINDL